MCGVGCKSVKIEERKFETDGSRPEWVAEVRRRNDKHEYQGIEKVNRDKNDNE